MSTTYGDIFTAYAVSCYGSEGMPIELSEPFQGVLEDFDGTYVYIRTDKYYCLRVDINELKNVDVLSKSIFNDIIRAQCTCVNFKLNCEYRGRNNVLFPVTTPDN